MRQKSGISTLTFDKLNDSASKNSKCLNNSTMAKSLKSIRVISLDCTGTLFRHRDPIPETYHAAMKWAHFPNPPSVQEIKIGFKNAYKQNLNPSSDLAYFGHNKSLSSRQWWIDTVIKCLSETGRELDRDYSMQEFNRFFRRVYQNYGCPQGYVELKDGIPFLKWCVSKGYLIGTVTNTPIRTMDSVLPFLGFHQFLRFFVCSQDVGSEKPETKIFDAAMNEIEFYRQRLIENKDEIWRWNEIENYINLEEVENEKMKVLIQNDYGKLFVDGQNLGEIKKDEILHIGDNFATDYCGAKAYGWNALNLDRSRDPNIRQYQDWIVGPDYEGKSEEEILANTVSSLDEVRQRLED